MNKKALKLISTALAVTMVAPTLAACGGGDKGDPNTLYVVCLDKGYGREWIDTIAKEYSEQTGFKVEVTADANATSLINTSLASKNNKYDLYISVGNDWKTRAAQGKFASLDDLLEETVDGKKVKDLVLPEYQNSIYMPDSNDDYHTYRLPWTAGVGGIYYNKAMFAENEWKVPQTYDELLELCQQIVDDEVPVSGTTTVEKVKPFVYTSANTDYFDYTVFTWWAQLAGKDAITEFTKYESSSNFDVSKNDTYAKLKTATEMWYGIFGNSNYYIQNDNNHTAQTRFANGYAAMMFNGDWLYNEILGYDLNNSDTFQLSYMQTPVAENAVCDSITYTIGEDQFIAIPSSSTKQSQAKEFIKLIISDYGCEVFANSAHGLLAYEGSLNAQTTDDFMDNLVKARSKYEYAFTSYPAVKDIDNVSKSNAMLSLSGLVDIWGTAAARPFERMLNGTDINSAFNTIKSNVDNQWGTWRKQAGLD